MRSGVKALRLWALALAGLAASPWAARATGFSANAAGTTGSDFLNLTVGARAAGMGGAFLTAVDDAGAVYWNPAALARIAHTSLLAMHNDYLAGIRSEYLAGAQRLDTEWVVGGSVHYVDIGSISQTDVSGNTVGTFNPTDYVYSISAGRAVAEMSDHDVDVFLGVTAKYFKSQIIQKASGYGADIGVLATFAKPVPYRVGFSVQNLGAGQKFDQVRDNLPLNIKIGGSVNATQNLLLASDFSFPQGGKIRAQLGGELSAGLSDALAGSLRAGFDTQAYKDQPGFSGFSFGAGLTVAHLSFDYAIVPFGDLGTAHRFSLGFKF